jgi:hypothetical protein
VSVKSLRADEPQQLVRMTEVPAFLQARLLDSAAQ